MAGKGVVGGADLRLIALPTVAVEDVDGVSCGIDEEDGVTTVGQSVADAAVVDEDGQVEAGGRAAAEEEEPFAGLHDGIGGEGEPVFGIGIIVAELPAGQSDRLRSGIEEFDELVFVGVSLSIPVGVAVDSGGRVGEDLVDDDRRGSGTVG